MPQLWRNLTSAMKHESRSKTCGLSVAKTLTYLSLSLQGTMEGLERDEGAARAAYLGARPPIGQPTPPVLVKQPAYVSEQAALSQGRPVAGLRGLSVPVSHPLSGLEESEFEAPEPQVGSPQDIRHGSAPPPKPHACATSAFLVHAPRCCTTHSGADLGKTLAGTVRSPYSSGRCSFQLSP